MRVAIIEDEQLAAERLVYLLHQAEVKVEIVKHLYSIEESVQWLKQNPAPDLLFLDIQLADGFCFEIFQQVEYKNPVIFTTAYDQYALDAFKLYSIDYLLKPVTASALQAALQKLVNIQTPVSVNYRKLNQVFEEASFKSRFLARAGQKMFFVGANDVEYFQADDKIVFLVDKDGNRLMIDYTLEKLQEVLNPKEFFRLNRQVIARYTSIAQIKPFVNSRYKLLLRSGSKTEEVILSRERVQEFKQWAEA